MRADLRVVAVGLGLFITAASGALAQQRAPRGPSTCNACHSELEFLRQNTGAMARARAVHVPDAVVAGSAHASLACADCHTGFTRFPHNRTETRSCASCHQRANEPWLRGEHVPQADKAGAACTDCHGLHDVESGEQLKTKAGIAAMNARCTGCHQASRLDPKSAHAEGALCSGCHGPHDTRPAYDRDSRLWVNQQLQTCGTCHNEIATTWVNTDVHAAALLARREVQGQGGRHRPPACTDCHGGHGMGVTPDSSLAAVGVERCGECHEKARKTFLQSYHGKATNLGSKAAAKCSDCHGVHTILPAANPESRVAQNNLVETCGACHEHARPAFVKYDAHPDFNDRERNPYIFASFWFMNALMLFVVIVFGAHTVLWWIRILIDRKRGAGHTHGDGA